MYYAVVGTTTRDIFDPVDSNGPEHDEESDGRFTSGLTEADPSYQYHFLDDGRTCKIDGGVISLDLVITLPQHADPSSLSNLQLSRWQDFARRVELHEDQHASIHLDRADSFKRRVEKISQTYPDCDALKDTIATIWNEERLLDDQQQESFHDREEETSRSLRGPVQQQIDDLEERRDGINKDLASWSLEIDRLKGDVEGVEKSMQPLKSQIDAIQEEYPDLVLPQDVFSKYDALVAEFNGLNDERNGLVVLLNAVVDQRNDAVKQFSALTSQLNQLIDELNWVP